MGLGGVNDEGSLLSDLKPFNKKGFLSTTLGFNKPKKLKIPPPPNYDAQAAAKAAQMAALKKKQEAKAATGYEDTVTNSGGAGGIVGGAPSGFQGTKTLAGT